MLTQQSLRARSEGMRIGGARGQCLDIAHQVADAGLIAIRGEDLVQFAFGGFDGIRGARMPAGSVPGDAGNRLVA
jgi:hypothetical protein